MTTVLVIIIVILALAVVMLLAKLKYPSTDGNMVVYDGQEKTTFSFEVKTDPDKWTRNKYLVLEVKDGSE